MHGISVLGSFILGLDVDTVGSGGLIARTARSYGLDILNVMVLTPLPGTRLWKTMEAEGRLVATTFPRDWKFFTLTLPVARFKQLSWGELIAERNGCYRDFYSYAGILYRVLRSIWYRTNPLVVLVSNLLIRANTLRLDRQAYAEFNPAGDQVPCMTDTTIAESTLRETEMPVYAEPVRQPGPAMQPVQVMPEY
jgi:radical SAM superfamily enzyme YgiQ (UPF0313 family)